MDDFNGRDVINLDPEKMRKSFKKNSGRYIGLAVAAIALLIFATQGWYTVSEQENAVVTTAGKVTDITGAGLHFKIPVIQTAHKVLMTIQGMTLGYVQEGNYGTFQPDDNLMISNDFNIVSIDFYAEWRVTVPEKFLFKVEEPVVLLTNIIRSSARDVVSSYMVDSVLTDGKYEIQTNIRELVNNVLDDYDIGIMVTNVIIQDAEPPTAEVIAAFKAVEDAKQKKDTLINEANRYYNENIPGARAEADRITKQAEAVKEARINEANGQVARFNEMYGEYAIYPEITKTRMYLETMEEIMPDIKMYIDGTGGSDILKLLDLNN